MAAKNTVLAGRYRLLGVVATSQEGNTWRAKDELLDRVVAVKELFPVCPFDVAHSDRVRARVIREARVATRLRHPHAITLHDVFEQNMTPYLVTEYPAAPSLAELVAQRGRLEPGEVAELGAQLASALTAAHADGIMHRRIAPDNVVVIPAGTAKITGFGMRSSSGLPAYLAPEVAFGSPADFPSDVFSLGATLYTALEGHPPSGELAPRANDPVLDVVLRLVHPDPQARPTMAEAERLLADLTRPHPHPAPARTPVGVLVAGAVLVLAASAAVTSMTGHRRTHQRSRRRL